MTPLEKFILAIFILNIIFSIYLRIKLTKKSKVEINKIPEAFTKDVNILINDGYKTTSFNNDSIRLIKKKVTYFHGYLFFLFQI